MLTSLASGRLFADRQGSGQVDVVGLHGWARDRRDLEVVLHGTDSLAVDLPGFGLSPPPPEPWGTDEYAAALVDVLADLDRPVLLGHSFGGRVALKVAVRHPDLVSGLVLTGVPLFRSPGGSRPAAAYRVARGLHRAGLLPEPVMERLRSRYGSEDYRNSTGVMRGVFVRVVNESYDDEVRALACPTALVWGADDTAAPLWMAERARDLSRHVALTVLPGRGHHVPLTAPDALRDAVAGMLRQTRGA